MHLDLTGQVIVWNVLFEIQAALSLTSNDFNYRWYWASLSSMKMFFPLFLDKMGGFLKQMQMKTAMLSHPSDVSVGLLSFNDLISQQHTSTGLWQHLMSVVLFSSVSNFMTSPLFHPVARSGLWTCNDNWEEKQCSAQLCTKSFCKELKLWVCAYDSLCEQACRWNFLLCLLCT